MNPIQPSNAAPVRANPYWQYAACMSVVALILLGVSWELWLAPLRPGGSWLVLKVLPLGFTLRGLYQSKVYTFQWTAMLSLLYVCEALVRATSDHGPSIPLAWLELLLSVILFVSALAYCFPYKQRTKQIQQARQSAV